MQTRREFFKKGGFIAAGFLGLQRLNLQANTATSMPGKVSIKTIPGYGPLISDPKRIFDLPKGFRYEVIAKKGEQLDDQFFLPFGQYKAKIDLKVMKTLEHKKDGKLILVTAINPTPAGEGKTTTSI